MGTTKRPLRAMWTYEQELEPEMQLGETWRKPSDNTAVARGASTNVPFTLSPHADATIPTVTIQSPSVNGFFGQNTGVFNISGLAGDDLGVQQVSYTVSGATTLTGIAAGTSVWSIPNLVLNEGLNVLIVRAADANGNVGTANITLVFDQTNPAIYVTAPVENAGIYYGSDGAISVHGNAVDESNVVSLTWRRSEMVGEVKTVTQTGVASVLNVEEKTFEINGLLIPSTPAWLEMTATDSLGNIGVTEIELSNDAFAPVLTIETLNGVSDNGSSYTGGSPYVVSGETTSRDLTVTGRITDDIAVASLTYELTGATSASGTATLSEVSITEKTFSLNFQDLNEGGHTLTMTAYDAAGKSHVKTLPINSVGNITLNVTISSTTTNLNLRTLLNNAGWNGVIPAVSTITILSGVIVGSANSSTPAIVTGDLTNADVTLVIQSGAYLVGAGGSAGGTGGTALQATSPLTVNNQGTLGGGGGGGGQGQSFLFNGYSCQGGNGGGGAGYVGGGSYVDAWQAANMGAVVGGSGSLTAGGAGAHGSIDYYGPSTAVGGTGGNGGALGNGGGAGGTGTPAWGSSYWTYGPAGAGKYLQGSAYVTWQSTGTRLGLVA